MRRTILIAATAALAGLLAATALTPVRAAELVRPQARTGGTFDLSARQSHHRHMSHRHHGRAVIRSAAGIAAAHARSEGRRYGPFGYYDGYEVYDTPRSPYGYGRYYPN